MAEDQVIEVCALLWTSNKCSNSWVLRGRLLLLIIFCLCLPKMSKQRARIWSDDHTGFVNNQFTRHEDDDTDGLIWWSFKKISKTKRRISLLSGWKIDLRIGAQEQHKQSILPKHHRNQSPVIIWTQLLTVIRRSIKQGRQGQWFYLLCLLNTAVMVYWVATVPVDTL